MKSQLSQLGLNAMNAQEIERQESKWNRQERTRIKQMRFDSVFYLYHLHYHLYILNENGHIRCGVCESELYVTVWLCSVSKKYFCCLYASFVCVCVCCSSVWWTWLSLLFFSVFHYYFWVFCKFRMVAFRMRVSLSFLFRLV